MSSNQYLRPEDLPITDAKKSPLALLAMTCSNIGADVLGTGKPMSLGYKNSSKKTLRVDSDPNESASRPDSAASDKNLSRKSSGGESNRSGCSSANSLSDHSNADSVQVTPATHHHRSSGSVNSAPSVPVSQAPQSNSSKISFKPYESVPTSKAAATTTMSCDRPASSNSDHQAAGAVSNGHHARNGHQSSGHHHHHHHRKSSQSPPNSNSKSGQNSSSSRPSSRSSPKNSSSVSDKSSSSHNGSSVTTTNSNAARLTELSKNHAAALKQADEAQRAAATTNGHYGHYGHSIMSSSEHEQLLKSASAHFSAAAAAAYQHQASLAMAHLGSKGTGGGGPHCTDPYCRGCQLALAGLPSSTPCCNGGGLNGSCPPGHPGGSLLHNPYAGLGHPGASPFGSRFPGLPSPGSAGLSGSAGPGGRPFTCSWTAGGSYCGKTFSSSEELLVHLKSHTTFSPGLASTMATLGQYRHIESMLTSPVAGLRRTAFNPANRHHHQQQHQQQQQQQHHHHQVAQSQHHQYHPYKTSPHHHGSGGYATSPLNPMQSVLSQQAALASLELHYPPGAAYGPYGGRLGAPIPP